MVPQVHGAPRRLRDLAQVAHEKQMLQVRRDRGEVLERLDGLLAPLGVARAQRRREDLLQQRGLALGGRAEHAQVAARDAVAGELGDRAHDLALGLVVVALAVAQLALDDPEVLELLHEPRLRARLVEHLLERILRAAGAHRDRQPPQRRARAPVGLARRRRLLGRAPGGELVTDHRQRQELVALQAQDRPQPRDVRGRVQAVTARRAARRQQLLVLEVADLRDRDVGELLLEPLADRPDRQRLRLPRDASSSTRDSPLSLAGSSDTQRAR